MRIETLREVLGAVADATIVVDERGGVAFANTAFNVLFGYAAGEAVGLSVEQLVPEEFRDSHAGHRRTYTHESSRTMIAPGRELWAVRKDGRLFPADIAIGPVTVGSEKFIIAGIREISSLLNLRSDLEESRVLNRAVFASLEDHIAVLDKDGRIRSVNWAWEMFASQNRGTSTTSLGVGADYLQVCEQAVKLGDPTAEMALEAIKSVLGGSRNVPVLEYPCHSPDEKRWFKMTVLPIRQGQQGVLVCHANITELKYTEEKLREAVEELTELKERLHVENLYLHEELDRAHGFDEIIGRSPALAKSLAMVQRVAATDANVLLLGETGTGKELYARAIHQRSRRAKGPLVTVNCAALPDSLIESELFGHVQGAFTGALRDKAGRFELAEGGTLFLDEVGEIDLDLQSKLLRVLQEREFERIGSGKTIKTNVRIIAATNRDLEQASREGSFRSDLYFRLNVFPIRIPPLRDRRDDIPLLIWHFVTKKRGDIGKTIESISEQAMNACMEYDWPGNVRELENIVERAMILSPGTDLHLESALFPSRATAPSANSAPSLEQVDRAHITRILEDCDWVIKGPGNAADQLGVAPSTLRYRMKKLGIKIPQRQPKDDA